MIIIKSLSMFNRGNNPFSKISTSMLGINWMASGIASIFSAIGFFVLKAFHIITAYPGIFILVSLAGIIASFVFWTKNNNAIARWVVLSVSIVLLVLTSWFKTRNEIEDDKANENELIADATDAGLSIFTDPSSMKLVQDSLSWFIPAVMEDKMMYVLIPSNISSNSVGRNAFDPQKIKEDSPNLEMRMIAPFYKMNGESMDGKYMFAGFYKPHMREGYEFKRCKVLPESVAISIKAMALINTDTRAAKRLFEKADSMNNAAAAGRLSLIYSQGIAVNRDKDQALRIAKRAAKGGSRMARLTYGRLMLLDSTYSAYDKAIAEEMLKRAAVVNTIVSKTIAGYSQNAIDLLCEYYWSTKRYEDAYQLTKRITESYLNPNVLYFNHLYNCLYTNRIKEAKSLLENGEQKGNPSAYLIHAEMFRDGLGCEKDYNKAQDLVGEAIRAAVEIKQPLKGSLPGFYDLMATVMEDASDSTGAMFWRGLADINFNPRVDDEK